jgi:glucokinase
LGGWLHERIRRPVTIDNDANVATLGEAACGAGRGHNAVFYVTLGSGVGGGLVVAGSIFHGAKPGESEIGHVRLDREGTILEQRCSGWAVDARIRELAKADPSSILARRVAGLSRGEARHLAAALEQSCPVAQEVLDDVAAELAFGLSHVVHLFHPEIIVLGGGLALVGERLRAAVAAALSRLVMDVFAPGPVVSLSALKEDAVPVGALLLAAGQLRQATSA